MAFTANTAFEQRVTNHEFEATHNITGKYQSSNTDADCSAGFLCVRASLMDNEGYTNIKNGNSWIMNAATSSAVVSDGIYACNPGNVNMIADPVTGAKYKVGGNVLGLGQFAGIPDTYTKIVFDGDHQYRIGIGNLQSALSTNTYLTIDAGQYKPSASAPTGTVGKPYFKVLGTGTFTQGAYAGFGYVDVEAHTALA